MNKKIRVPGIALGLITMFTSEAVVPAPDKIAYELQERCGRSVEKWFKREYGNGSERTKDGQTLTKFRNHYNSRMNKCFMLLTSTSFRQGKRDDKESMIRDETLYDFIDNTEYGSLVEMDRQMFSCYIREKQCASRAEWELAIKPYLEE